MSIRVILEVYICLFEYVSTIFYRLVTGRLEFLVYFEKLAFFFVEKTHIEIHKVPPPHKIPNI